MPQKNTFLDQILLRVSKYQGKWPYQITVMHFINHDSRRPAIQIFTYVFQTADDPDPRFLFRVDGTGLFTITPDGFVAQSGDTLDFEDTQQVTFRVSRLYSEICLETCLERPLP